MQVNDVPDTGNLDELMIDLREMRRESSDTRGRGRARGVAFAEMSKRFANQYAAYREIWDGDQLVEPYIVATGPTLKALRARLGELPSDQRAGVQIQFLGESLR